MNTKENTASKKSKIMEVLQNCKKEAEKFGVELDYNPDVFFDDDHLDPVWYGGSIASLMVMSKSSATLMAKIFCIRTERIPAP